MRKAFSVSLADAVPSLSDTFSVSTIDAVTDLFPDSSTDLLPEGHPEKTVEEKGVRALFNKQPNWLNTIKGSDPFFSQILSAQDLAQHKLILALPIVVIWKWSSNLCRVTWRYFAVPIGNVERILSRLIRTTQRPHFNHSLENRRLGLGRSVFVI